MSEKIKPVFPGGTVVYDSKTMLNRLDLINKIQNVFSLYGFTPLQTPILQRRDILTGGDADMRIFSLEEEVRTDSARALRFDLTIPFSVYLAQSMHEVKLPLKRSEIGRVFRPETPQKGRYNEFYQCDYDIAGTDSRLADAEIIGLLVATMRKLEVGDFTVRINSRKILNALPEIVGYENSKNAAVLRILDKMDKIGWTGVNKELQENADTLLDDAERSKIAEFLAIKNVDATEVIAKVAEFVGGSQVGQDGIAELSEIVSYLPDFDVSESDFVIDLSIARGLGYYTGLVFEANLDKLPSIGSVASGGRYNDLVDKFGQSIPAVGGSIGIDRLYAALIELGLTSELKTNTKALVLPLGEMATNFSVAIVTALRSVGVPSEIYMGKHKKMGDMIAYAVDMGIPDVIIIGEDEVKKGEVTVKNLASREQKTIPAESVVEYFTD